MWLTWRATVVRSPLVRPIGLVLQARFSDRISPTRWSLGLVYVPAPAAIVEMRRVLSPGGRIAVSVWGERRRCPLLSD